MPLDLTTLTLVAKPVTLDEGTKSIGTGSVPLPLLWTGRVGQL